MKRTHGAIKTISRVNFLEARPIVVLAGLGLLLSCRGSIRHLLCTVNSIESVATEFLSILR